MKDKVVKPLVSVILPCYNHEKFVEESIESVLSQSYGKIELIVIDDGSTDATVRVVKKLQREKEFKFFQQSNQGLSRTLNLGIKDCLGTYVAILASDDYYDINKIALQVSCLMDNQGSEFCYTKSAEFDSSTGKVVRIFPKASFEGEVLNQIFLRPPYAAGSVMFSKALFERVGGFDENLKYEDWDFSIRCAANTKFCCVNEVLFYYRSHATNTSKVMDRRSIFHQKAMTLSKSYHLVSPFTWLKAVVIHFVYDHFLYKLKSIKGLLH